MHDKFLQPYELVYHENSEALKHTKAISNTSMSKISNALGPKYCHPLKVSDMNRVTHHNQYNGFLLPYDDAITPISSTPGGSSISSVPKLMRNSSSLGFMNGLTKVAFTFRMRKNNQDLNLDNSSTRPLNDQIEDPYRISIESEKFEMGRSGNKKYLSVDQESQR